GVLAAGPGLHDVVEVSHAGRLGRRLERRQAGVADRARGQPQVAAGVVAGVDRKLARRQRCAPVAGRETDRGVDSEWHPLVETVVDDGRDQWTLSLETSLALDHRGDRDNVEG